MTNEKEAAMPAEEKPKRREKKFSEAELEMSKTFHRNLNTLCGKKGKTQTQIAKELGWTQSKISKLMNGQVPSLIDLSKLADYFGVTVDSLLTDGKKDGVAVDWRSLTLKQAFWILDDMKDVGFLTSYQGLPNILSDTIKKWRCTAIQIKQSSIPEKEHVLEMVKRGFCEGLPDKQLDYYCGWNTKEVI